MRTRNCCLLFLLIVTAAGVHATGTDANYRAPRAGDGRPDLSGVWNFSSDVPLERPLSAGDKKFFTWEELEALKAAKARAFDTVAKMAPVEAVSLAWLDYGAQIENLRTSLITYPDNGRVPKVVEGIRRVAGPDEIIAALSDATGTIPPTVAAFLAGGKRDGPEDFGNSERCLFGGGPPLSPGFDSNYVQVYESACHEGNYSLSNMLSGARKGEQEAAQ